MNLVPFFCLFLNACNTLHAHITHVHTYIRTQEKGRAKRIIDTVYIYIKHDTHTHTHTCDPTKKKTISCTLNRAIVHNLLFKLSVSCLPSPGFPTHVFRPTNYHAYNCLISVPSTLTFRFHRRYLPDPSLTVPNVRPHDRTTALHARARITLSPRN